MGRGYHWSGNTVSGRVAYGADGRAQLVGRPGRADVIRVTRMGSGEQLYVNSEHIEWIESTPDTIIVLQSGKRIICVEPPADIISRVIEFRRRIVMPTVTEP